jgi:hypothetical protein
MRILLTCGLGDFIAMASYFTDAERASVQTIHWATRARESLMQLVPFVFPNVAEHVVERDTWGAPFSKTFCISSRAELPGLDPAVTDWSVKFIVEDVKRKRRKYQGSTLANGALCDISRLDLPARYYVVHPHSENARTPIRDLTSEEWAGVHRHLHQRGIPIVIVNKGGERLPEQLGVIDLSDQLTLLEAIEVTKHAAGFVGAASLFSVIASKTLPIERIRIKGSADLKKNYYWFYYAPHATNAFITDDLLKMKMPDV